MLATDIIINLSNIGIMPRNLCADSRRVRPGDIFIAMPGGQRDGRQFIDEALTRGAAAILWESGDGAQLNIPAPNLPIPGLRQISGKLAHLIYKQPSDQMWLCGVTGTNGKTSVSQWIAQASTLLGRQCAVIGTLGSGFPDNMSENANTTPDAISTHATLHDAMNRGAVACAMEVSSIGIDQNRIDGLSFSAAVFTNLTRDHLEYHGNMDRYADAKMRLFFVPGLKNAVINLDDPFGAQLYEKLANQEVGRIGYTLMGHSPEQISGRDDVLMADDLHIGPHGMTFTLRSMRYSGAISLPLHGRFNVSNALAVIGALLSFGLRPDLIPDAMSRLVPPAGRMQAIQCTRQGKYPLVIVDYAHTPDALQQVLETLRSIANARKGRLICLFGCGGERDPGKRPLMGNISQYLADRVIVSNDNPRNENPQSIIAEILSGMAPHTDSIEAIPDRSEAIHFAVQTANANDVLLIAGKGHESYQEVGGQRLVFSDAAEARQALLTRSSSP